MAGTVFTRTSPPEHPVPTAGVEALLDGKEASVSEGIEVRATAPAVRAELARFGPVASHPDGLRVDLAIRPDPIQLAHAECLLARRGEAPDLRLAPALARLCADGWDGRWRLRFDRVVRIGSAPVDPTAEQARLFEEILRALARRIEAALPVPA